MKNLAIIGGGFSGTMTAIWLMRLSKTPIRIHLIDKKDFARGIAYAHNPLCFLLNARVDQMSALPDEPLHFHRWLEKNEPQAQYGPLDFVPRKIYGDYLEDLLKKTIEEKKSSLTVEFLTDETLDLDSKGKTLTFKSSPPLKVDHIVVATGLSHPLDLDLKAIDLNAPEINIIGSSLSMVDIVLHLNNLQYKGVIKAYSRRGRLPRSHHFYDPGLPKPSYDFSTHYALAHVVASARENLKHYPWHLVIDAFRPHSQGLWSRWGQRERAQFLRHFRALWELHRHRIPASSKETLDHMISSGQLKIIKTGFNSDSLKALPSSAINCRGFSLHSSFLAKLAGKEFIEYDPFMLGAKEKTKWISVVGSLQRGELWECTAVGELRLQAKIKAQFILNSLSV